MVKLLCHCLNVRIHVKGGLPLEPISIPDLSLDDDCSQEDFFASQLAQVQLDLEGFSLEHKFLQKKKDVGPWSIYRCISCDMWTHALSMTQGTATILVNLNMQSEPTNVDRLVHSSEFSPLYHIVLHSKDDNHPIRTMGIQSGKYVALQETLSDVQKQLNEFLIQEETNMETRIRMYEEEQRSAYAELQSKARRDKNAMLSIILSAEEQELADSLSDAMTESPVSPLSPERNSNEGFSYPQSPDNDSRKSILKKSSKVTLSRSTSLQPRFITPKVEQSPDADALFDLDGFQEDPGRPFYESDGEEEENDTDDSYNDAEERTTSLSKVYSCSVPISVPMWGQVHGARKSYSEQFDEEDQKGELAHDPQNIAASMRALARSIHEDDREMFGDLPRRPRPRFNTMEFGNL